MEASAFPDAPAGRPPHRGGRWTHKSGTSPNRSFVLASEFVWRHYHARQREIARDWHARSLGDEEDFGMQLYALALMRESEREDLRREVRLLVEQGNTGSYLIPV